MTQSDLPTCKLNGVKWMISHEVTILGKNKINVEQLADVSCLHNKIMLLLSLNKGSRDREMFGSD